MSEQPKLSIPEEELTLGGAGTRIAAISGLVGVLALAGAAALAASTGGWARFQASYLTSYVYFLSLALGGLFFVLVQHATRSGWSVVVRRLAEVVAPNLFLPMALLAIPVWMSLRDLYPWTDAAAVAADPLLRAKEAWLNVPFFFVRTAIYFGVWTVLSLWFYKRSVAQDRTGDPRTTIRLETTSTAALVLFAFTTTFFAFDYIMSLTPHWASTIFGVYFFAGCVLGFFALLTVLAYTVQSAGGLRNVISHEHYHDLGKLVFAFIVFWAYIGFSQYMLIWYANLPEETVWLKARQSGSWTSVSVLLLFGHFIVPFLALLSRNIKRRRVALVSGAAWMLAMQWVDVYWLVMPSRFPGSAALSPMDVLIALGIGGLFFAAVFRRMSAQALMPVQDPRLPESMSFENF